MLNNPLNATDPSGFFFKKLWNKIRPFVGAIVGIVLAAYCPPCTASLWGAIGAGAAAGAAGAAANGGNILRGALTGAISAAAFYGVGSAFQGAEGSGNFLGSGMSAGDLAAKVFAHGMVGGVMSVLQGGKFGHGFASAGVTQAFAGGIDRIGGSKFSSSYFDAGNRALRIAAAAIVGGTSSVMSGGKFANGAMTGAFSRAFNDESMHDKVEKIKKDFNGRVAIAARDEIRRLGAMSNEQYEEEMQYYGYERTKGLSTDISKLRLIKQWQTLGAEALKGTLDPTVSNPNFVTIAGWGVSETAQTYDRPALGQFGRALGWAGTFLGLKTTLDQFPSENFQPFISYRCSGGSCGINALYVY